MYPLGKVLEIASETGGAKIFQFRTEDGGIRYFVKLGSVTTGIDDGPWEPVPEFTFSSLAGALEKLGPGGDWIRLTPVYIHYDFRSLVASLVNIASGQNSPLGIESLIDAREKWVTFINKTYFN